jgi:hypothetical protein
LINQIRIYKIFVVFQFPLINDFIVIPGLIFKLHRDVRFNIVDIINLIVFFYVPIVKPSLKISSPTSFKPVVATAHTRSNNREPIFAQLEQFMLKPRPPALDLLCYAPNTQEKASCVCIQMRGTRPLFIHITRLPKRFNDKRGRFDFYNKDNNKIIISFEPICTIKLQ